MWNSAVGSYIHCDFASGSLFLTDYLFLSYQFSSCSLHSGTLSSSYPSGPGRGGGDRESGELFFKALLMICSLAGIISLSDTLWAPVVT